MNKIKLAYPQLKCRLQEGTICVARHANCSEVAATMDKYRLKFTFDQADNYELRLPLEMFMRQEDGMCKILVTNLGDGPQSNYIVLGDAWL